MAFQILISPDALRDVAAKFRSFNLSAPEMVRACTADVQECWEGAGANEALEALYELNKATSTLDQELSNLSESLMNTANAFEDLDNGGQGGGVRWVSLMPTGLADVILDRIYAVLFTGEIRVVPDRVRAASARCRSAAENLRELSSFADSALSSLANSWSGNSYSRFADDANQMIDGVRRLSDATEELADKIRIAADRYEEVDRSVASL